MNPLLSRLQPYPFARLRQLFDGVTPDARLHPINMGIGEPRHATPDFIVRAYADALGAGGLAGYPATGGEPALRQACAR
jgi:N-succinyldiaminopimelate aminotransferase